MNGFTRTFLVTAAAAVILAAACPVQGGGCPGETHYWPNRGQFYYNGQLFADSYMCWANSGGWSVSDPGYEHDLVVRKFFFTSCTSFTNLPNGYDDCPTAGVLETNPNYYAFSFGSFHARNIQPTRDYYGSWNFTSNGSPSPTDFRLNGQEVYRFYCPFDSIWCMEDIRSQKLLPNFTGGGTLTRGQVYWNCWPWDGWVCW